MSTTDHIDPAQECWSKDNEDFNARSLAELLERHEDLAAGTVVWRGVAVHPNNTHLCDANDVIDLLADRAHDIAGEHADSYPQVDAEARAELDQLLSDWIDKNAPPSFYTVENIEPHTLTEGDVEAHKEKQ
jgi:hypothetical protein